MIRQVQNYFSSLSPMFIDGLIYVTIAMFTAVNLSLCTDEAAKYIMPIALFWLRNVVGWGSAAFLALKMYRNTSYADHKKKQADEETAFVTKSSL